MKLLHVVGSIDPRTGGTYEGLIRTCEVMQARGVEVEIASLDAPWFHEEVVRGHGFPIHRIGGARRSYYGYGSEARAWLRAEVGGYDAVILHGLWQYHGVAASRACRRAGVPYYLFTHGMLDPWFNRTYPLKRLKKQIYWWLCEAVVLRHAEAVLFTSEEERRLARTSFRPYRAVEQVIGYGTRAPETPGAELRPAFAEDRPAWGRRPFFLFLSRLEAKKGLDLLLRAYAGLRARYEDFPDLVIAGSGRDEYVESLKKTAPAQGVHWVGHLDGALKWRALAAAEGMVLVSHQENFGIVVAEALAVGTPVLISDKVNIWREVDNGGAGWIESDTAEGARRLFERWQATPAAEREAMRDRAEAVFREQFEIGRPAGRLLELIENRGKKEP